MCLYAIKIKQRNTKKHSSVLAGYTLVFPCPIVQEQLYCFLIIRVHYLCQGGNSSPCLQSLDTRSLSKWQYSLYFNGTLGSHSKSVPPLETRTSNPIESRIVEKEQSSQWIIGRDGNQDHSCFHLLIPGSMHSSYLGIQCYIKIILLQSSVG